MKIRMLLSFLLAMTGMFYTYANKTIHIKPSQSEDISLIIKDAIDGEKEKNIKIVLEKSTYRCSPDYAFEKYCAITNHGNGAKRILFPISDLESLEIEGNGATLLCHGRLMPFLVENCSNIIIKDLTINWDIPFTFLCELTAVNEQEGWREVRPFTDGFSWTIQNGRISFPDIDGFNYSYLGSTLPFDVNTKRVVDGALDTNSNPTKVERKADGILRIHEKMRYYPPIGSVLSSKGDREHDRYAPAFGFKGCKNIVINGVTVNHALGMGFLFERSEDINIINSRVVLPENSKRVVSTTADATHFANCKGNILLENCRFENMLDDGTNVHGTYVVVDKVINNRTLRVKLVHFEQLGFDFAHTGDDVWFIMKPSPSRAAVGRVKSVRTINECYSDIEFDSEIPAAISSGDILENKTWNPSYTMRGCTIQNHRARSVILKTPCKIVIENNNFSSMMSAIQLRGDTYFWYESGAVEDVLIQNNKFTDCGNSGVQNAILYVTPRLSKDFDSSVCFDKNIRFVSNEIIGSNSRVIWADRVDGLTVRGNKMIFNDNAANLYPDNPVYELINCKNATIENNTLSGKKPKYIMKADESSRQSLKYKD